MSNLGTYQLLTTIAKKVGGPVVLLVGTAVAGYATLRPVEAGAKRAGRRVADAARKRRGASGAVTRSYTVNADADAGGGLLLSEGDVFLVLERDGDAVLVELEGNADNPFYVSAALLVAVSDFDAIDG